MATTMAGARMAAMRLGQPPRRAVRHLVRAEATREESNLASIGVCAAIFDENQRLLCVRRNYGDHCWTLPGGGMERGESPLAALAREVREETGYHVRPDRLIGVYSQPWKDDLVLCFSATIIGCEPWKSNGEIAEIGFFTPDILPEPFSRRARSRLADVLKGRTGVMRVFEASVEGGAAEQG